MLVHGQPITANEVEDLLGRHRSNEAAVSLFNAIVWSVGDRRQSTVPAFTERVNVKDRGVDAEWDVDIPSGGAGAGLVSPGWTVYQYKRREVSAGGGRDAVVKALVKELTGALQSLVEAHAPTPLRSRGAKGASARAATAPVDGNREAKAARKTATKTAASLPVQLPASNPAPGPAVEPQKLPARYVLVTNVHLSRAERDRIETAIRKAPASARAELRGVPVEVIGAAELAAFLNDVPHLRAAFVHTTVFESWAAHWRLHQDEKLHGRSVPLLGRDAVLADLRAAVADPTVRALVITGPPDAGKTRLALEATRERALETVVALDPRVMRVSELLTLTVAGRETVVIVEDPDAQTAEDLVRRVLGTPDLKLVITLPTPERAPRPGYGRDARVAVVSLDALDARDARAVVEAAAPALDYGLATWIVEQSGGIPGVLLTAASVGAELGREAGDFAEQVAAAFARRTRDLLGTEAVRVLEVLSLMSAVGVAGEAEGELRVILEHLGGTLDADAVRRAILPLAEARALRRRGPWVDVVPPLLARRLAADVLAGRYAELLAVFARLGDAARLRLLRRLRDVPAAEASRLWAELFAPDGLFGTPTALLANAALLHEIIEAAPERGVEAIERAVSAMAVEERLMIDPDARRHLVHTLDTLLFFRDTAERALGALLLLAEAETETWANNASGLFAEVFHPLHPQFPLPLDDRLRVLTAAAGRRPESRVLAVRAADAAFKRLGGFSLRPSLGPTPLDGRPAMTYGDARRYLTAVADLVLRLVADAEPAVARAAGREAPSVVGEVAVQIGWAEARPRFADLLAVAQRAPDVVSPVDLSDALDLVLRIPGGEDDEEASADDEAQSNLSDVSDSGSSDLAPASHDVNDVGMEPVARGMRADATALKRALTEGSFALRLRKWAGRWHREDHDYTLVEGQRVYRHMEALAALAREAIRDPALLTGEDLAWLDHDEAQKAREFWSALGRQDVPGHFATLVEARAATDDEALQWRRVAAFAEYTAGRARLDRPSVHSLLDELARTATVDPVAVLEATRLMDGDARGFERVLVLLDRGAVAPGEAAQRLAIGPWMDALTPEQILQLAERIAGERLERAGPTIDFLYRWFWRESAVSVALLSLAWRLVEAVAPLRTPGARDVDRLAAVLATHDPDRAFALLATRLRHLRPLDEWMPLGHHGGHTFWDRLCALDASRAVRVAIEVAAAAFGGRYPLLFGSRGLIDQERLAAPLLAVAADGETHALAVANVLTSTRPGFWPIATALTAQYPRHDGLKRSLTSGLLVEEGIVHGEASERLTAHRVEVDGQLADPSVAKGTRAWLRDVRARIDGALPIETAAEVAEAVNEARGAGSARSPDDERRWAIQALVREQRYADLPRIITRDEFARVSPGLGLAPEVRAACDHAFNAPSTTRG